METYIHILFKKLIFHFNKINNYEDVHVYYDYDKSNNVLTFTHGFYSDNKQEWIYTTKRLSRYSQTLEVLFDFGQ